MGDILINTAQYEDFDDPELDAVVEKAIDEFHTPGVAVLVVHGDRIFAKGYGFSDLEQQVPVTPHTLFFTASTTKSFTAAMAAHLVESADFPAINWQTPLVDLLREDWLLDQTTPAGQWATNYVTIEDALSHRTGLPRHDMAWINSFCDNRGIVRKLRHLPVHRTLREKWEYCNNAFTAVSVAIETVLNQSFKDSLKQHIFEPLHMDSTTYYLPDALELVDRHEELSMARGYLWDADAHDYESVPFDAIPPSRGSGGIISHILDYRHWVRHLMDPTGHSEALGESAVKAMRTPRMLVDRSSKSPFVGPEAYCLGLYSQVYRGREIISHSGAIGGYMTNMMMVPPVTDKGGNKTNGWAVVTMQNTYSLAQDVVCWHLLDKHLETPETERRDMAQAARDSQAESEAKMKLENVLDRLFGGAPQSHIHPALPLQAYEGIYRHPAYYEFKVSLSPLARRPGDKRPVREPQRLTSDDNLDQSETAPRLYLGPSGSKPVYLDTNATLHHVTGEHWWAYQRDGPTHWLTDRALKVQFVIGPKGTVTGMKYQAEPEMPEYLAFFERVE